LEKAGARACGHNSHSVGIAYESGLNVRDFLCDTRISHQRNSLQSPMASRLRDFPGARIVGHQDLSPDLDGDGEIFHRDGLMHVSVFDVETTF
jgi:N-acetylmuramoyl-L-alanine amidase